MAAASASLQHSASMGAVRRGGIAVGDVPMGRGRPPVPTAPLPPTRRRLPKPRRLACPCTRCADGHGLGPGQPGGEAGAGGGHGRAPAAAARRLAQHQPAAGAARRVGLAAPDAAWRSVVRSPLRSTPRCAGMAATAPPDAPHPPASHVPAGTGGAGGAAAGATGVAQAAV